LKQIRKRLTYANVMSSMAVFLVLGGASALAAGHLGKNTVGSKQLKKNAVTAAKIKKNAVTGAKLKKNAVTAAKIKASSVDGSKVKDGSLTGSDINVGTLGTVPSATNAASAASAGTAGSLSGHTPFYVRLGFGQSHTLASNGSVSLVADCYQESGDDYARILEQTSQNGAVAGGYDDWEGGSEADDFLNVNTDADERELVYNYALSGETYVESAIDQGWVIGPDNKGLTTNSEGIALGLNYRGSGCLFAGVIDAIG
jgi:hypothetical protein